MSGRPVALVTGGSRGIGRAISVELARTHDVVVNYRTSQQQAAGTVDEIVRAGGTATAIRADVADPHARRELIEAVIRSVGRLDVLVNNAGIGVPRRIDLLDVTESEWEQVLRVNLYAPFFLSQHAAEVMLQLLQEGTIDRGTIINISSVSAYAVSVDRAAYCVAKAGLAMVTKLFAARLAADNIRVYEVRPGVIRTDMTRPVEERYDQLFQQGLCPIARWGDPREVARVVALLCTTDLSYSTGEVINVDGGFHIRRL